MKKILAIVLVVAMAFSMVACQCSVSSTTTTTTTTTPAYKVAMITDYGDITDESFNQATYEACKEYAADHSLEFNYFKPAGDSTAERVAMMEKAIDEGFNVLVMPGYAFAGAIVETAPKNKDVKFVALDVSEYDLTSDANYKDGCLENVYSMVYQEELAGYMAGYAAAKMGYKKLGFLGGMAVPAVIRYGYGFVQGVNDVAKELGASDIEINYAYGNQFFGDADITGAMDTWYGAGEEVVFACGGGIYTSACEAAAKVGGKVIGVDVDQAPTLNKSYGDGICITSAMKGLAASTKATLKTIVEDNGWSSIAGKIANLGLVSGTDVEANFVQIPTKTTAFNDSFKAEDYAALVGKLFSGEIKVDNDTTKAPVDFATSIKLNDLGNLK